MTNSAAYIRFIKAYEAYIQNTLDPQHLAVSTFFNRWRQADFWSKYARSPDSPFPSPIRAIYTRIKRPEKVADKIYQKTDMYPDGLSAKSFKKMHDCIGVRIIVYFLSQLPMIDRELRRSPSMEISVKQPPEAYLSHDLIDRFGLSHLPGKFKENGYYSIHYVIRQRKQKKADKNPWFEVQVRTMAQELWCEMEHILAYKSERRPGLSSKRRFQILSREIAAIDEHFNLLYEELLENQENAVSRDDHLLNGANLPNVLNSLDLRCAQQDLNIILSMLQSRGIHRIKDLVQLATPTRLDTIKNTFMSKIGRQPTGFEVVSSLSILKTAELPAQAEKEEINTHIKATKVWNEFRKKTSPLNKNNPRTYEW